MTLLFLLGVIEMVIVTMWTKAVVEARIVASGVITLMNIFIWYYVLEKIVNNVSNFGFIVAYAIGCALGTMIVTALSVPRYQQWLKKHYERFLENRTVSIVNYDITS